MSTGLQCFDLEMRIIGLQHALARLDPEYAKNNNFVEYKKSMWHKESLEFYRKNVLKET